MQSGRDDKAAGPKKLRVAPAGQNPRRYQAKKPGKRRWKVLGVAALLLAAGWGGFDAFQRLQVKAPPAPMPQAQREQMIEKMDQGKSIRDELDRVAKQADNRPAVITVPPPAATGKAPKAIPWKQQPPPADDVRAARIPGADKDSNGIWDDIEPGLAKIHPYAKLSASEMVKLYQKALLLSIEPAALDRQEDGKSPANAAAAAKYAEISKAISRQVGCGDMALSFAGRPTGIHEQVQAAVGNTSFRRWRLMQLEPLLNVNLSPNTRSAECVFPPEMIKKARQMLAPKGKDLPQQPPSKPPSPQRP